MTGFGVIQEALRAAAEHARAAGRQVQPTALSGPVSLVGEAVPGTDAVPAAQRLAVTWTGALESWRNGMEQHAANKAASALTYSTTDTGERDRFAGGLV